MADQSSLQQFVEQAAERLAVPGVAVGVYHAGEEHYAYFGVTSVEHPLQVDADTLFQFDWQDVYRHGNHAARRPGPRRTGRHGAKLPP